MPALPTSTLPDELGLLLSVRIDHDSLCAGDDPRWLGVPASPGVVLFEDEFGRPILIRPIGDARAFVRRRFTSDPDDTGPRTDYRAITRCVRVAPTGLTIVAELLSTLIELWLDPDSVRIRASRLTGCVVACDPTARLPKFSAIELRSVWSGGTGLPEQHLAIGPFTSTLHAQRWIETVIDLFDLCRYDHLLMQTPHATACVYSQMGKCPAPCDGSEPIESYRERFARAAGFTSESIARECERVMREMRKSAEELRFEQAAAMKERLLAIESLGSGAAWPVGDVLSMRWLLEGRAERSRWHRRVMLSTEGLHLFADSTGPDDPPSVAHAFSLPDPCAGWMLLAVLVDQIQRGLGTGERASPLVREYGSP